MGVVSAKEEKERTAFERDLAAHVAQLSGFARPYTGRLPRKELTEFLAYALEIAWENRADMNPRKYTLLQWWAKCLRAAALQRSRWTQVYSHKTITISGRELGREESI